MKKKDFIQLAAMAALLITGIVIGKFIGGLITGACACLLVFVTVGKIAFNKTKARIDASLEVTRQAMNAVK